MSKKFVRYNATKHLHANATFARSIDCATLRELMGRESAFKKLMGEVPAAYEHVNALNIPHRIIYIRAHEKDGRQADQWYVEIGTQSFDYHTGTGRRVVLETYGQWYAVTPHLADILSCLLSDAYAVTITFAEWCAELGLSDDSIKARDLYFACQASHNKLCKALDGKTRTALANIFEEHPL